MFLYEQVVESATPPEQDTRHWLLQVSPQKDQEYQ